MRHVVADIEGNGLLQPGVSDEGGPVTRVHSLVIIDLETGEQVSCAQDEHGTVKGYESIETGLQILLDAHRIYFHNGIEYDVPALEKIYPGWDVDHDKVVDTHVQCRTRFAHQKDLDYGLARRGQLPGGMIGQHTLEAWGYRLRLHKAKYDGGWDFWSKEMQDYCLQDVIVLCALVKYIKRRGYSAESMRLEHDLSWYLAQQRRNGWPFDVEKAQALQAMLAGKREALKTELVNQFGWWWKPNGKVFIPKHDNKRYGYVAGAACQKIKQVWFNPGSRQHIAKVLQERFDWQPETFADSGQPEISEKTLKRLSHIPDAAKLIDYLVIDKRLGQLAEGKQAWFNHVDERHAPMPAIHHRCKHVGTITHRASHSFPNLGQVPKVGNPYGAECRELFRVPPGWVMVGADASGLELRMLGHFMARYDDGEYVKILLDGDIHTLTMKALGITDRDKAKTFFYAFLYGSGAQNLGSLLRPDVEDQKQRAIGADFIKQFLKGLPALSLLMKAVQQRVKEDKYLLAPDGRQVFVRSQHAALNTLLQSAGSIAVKKWIVLFAKVLTEQLGPQGWDGEWAGLGYVHDEVQLAVKPEHVETVKEVLISTMPKVGDHFNMRCPLAAEAKHGANWAQTH